MNKFTKLVTFAVVAAMHLPMAMAISPSLINESIIITPLTQEEENNVMQYVPDLFIPLEVEPSDPEPSEIEELQKAPLGYDLVTCSISSETLNHATNDQVTMNCELLAEADLTAGIVVEGKHTVFKGGAQDAPEVKKVGWNIGTQAAGQFSIAWNGVNELDLKVAPGEFTFVVAAMVGGYEADISMQHVTVINEEPVVVPVETPSESSSEPGPEPVEVPQPGEDSTTLPEVTEKLETNEQCAGFPDVAADDPLCPAVEFAKDIGAITGTGNGDFDPNSKLQRDQIAKIVLVAFGLFDENEDYCNGNEAFPDAGEDKWAHQYICRAKSLGAVTGYPDGTFKPAQLVSRVEFLAFILRNLEEGLPESGENYNDAKGNEWYSKYTRFAFKHNLFLGSKLNLTQSVTRIEVAQILYRLHVLGKI